MADRPRVQIVDLEEDAEVAFYHRECDPHPDTEGYSISAHRCSTFPELVAWTAHLFEKRWLQHTDWAAVLRSILRNSSGAEVSVSYRAVSRGAAATCTDLGQVDGCGLRQRCVYLSSHSAA